MFKSNSDSAYKRKRIRANGNIDDSHRCTDYNLSPEEIIDLNYRYVPGSRSIDVIRANNQDHQNIYEIDNALSNRAERFIRERKFDNKTKPPFQLFATCEEFDMVTYTQYLHGSLLN